jgi:CRP/FNR family transcriptional regulator
MRAEHVFCDLPPLALRTFDHMKSPIAYPKGSILFLEGQAPRGIYVLCKGRVKLSLSANDGKTLILKLAEPGEVLGLSATVAGKPYELSAETMDTCQVNFVKRDDFLRFLKLHVEVCFRAAEQLSKKYNNTCYELRSLGLSHSASERLAKLLLEWNSMHGKASKNGSINMSLTHEEMAQMIGTSRETVTRLFADFKKRHILEGAGSTLSIKDMAALRGLATS